MNAILGFSQLLLRSDLSPDQQQRLQLVHGSAKHLLGIVNDVLDMSKLQAGGISFQQKPMGIVQELELCLSLVAPQAEEKGLTIHSSLDPNLPGQVWGDAMRLRQVVFNLLNNAIRFTQEGQVTLEAALVEASKEEARITFSVADTGIGIPEAEQERVFEEFAQVESGSARSYGGTGLGLPICKRIVEGQGGEISIESEEGKGTRISFSLGFALQGEMPKGSGMENAVLEAPPKRVLVVDDAWFNRRLLLEILTARSVEAEEAENGEAALERLGKGKYDVVLLDIRMPGIDGLEVLRRIRSGNAGAPRDLPVLALTAAATEAELAECRAAGCNAILTKPFEEAELARLLHLPAPAPAPKPSPAALFSLARLEKMGRGDQAFVQKMAGSYRDMLQAALEKWEGNWENDLQALSDTAHKLAPPTKHIGADKLFSLLKALEKEADGSADPEKIQQFLSEIRLISERLLPALDQALNKDTHG